MTEAIFGLLGVVVGGVMQSSATWWMERRREDWAARKAGRLLAPAFGRCQFILDVACKHGTSWGMIGAEVDDCLVSWPKHADALAGTISQSEWNTILQAVSALQRLQQRAHATPEAAVEEEHREFLGDVSEVIWGGAFACSFIGTVGVRRNGPMRLLRRLRIWTRGQRRLEEEADEIVRYSYEVQGADPPSRD